MFCIVTLVESCIVIHIVYRGVGVVNEGLGELIDEWARILVPGAYVIAISTIFCMDLSDGYKEDSKATMYSAMGQYKFSPQVAIAPIVVSLTIGLWLVHKGKSAFNVNQRGKDGALPKSKREMRLLEMLRGVEMMSHRLGRPSGATSAPLDSENDTTVLPASPLRVASVIKNTAV